MKLAKYTLSVYQNVVKFEPVYWFIRTTLWELCYPSFQLVFSAGLEGDHESDSRDVNKRIQRQPFPIPKIPDLLLKLEGFQWATSLDLNMGYYHIELSPFSKKLCTVVMPWGKYEYQRLPMGLCNSPDIFQEYMGELLGDLEHVGAYIDDLLIISKGSYQDHLQKLDEVFARLEAAGVKSKCCQICFGQDRIRIFRLLDYQAGRPTHAQ